jgi:hypothetical protein
LQETEECNVRKKSNVERAFEAYCEMNAGEREAFRMLCQGHDRALNGSSKPKSTKKAKPPVQLAPAAE